MSSNCRERHQSPLVQSKRQQQSDQSTSGQPLASPDTSVDPSSSSLQQQQQLLPSLPPNSGEFVLSDYSESENNNNAAAASSHSFHLPAAVNRVPNSFADNNYNSPSIQMSSSQSASQQRETDRLFFASNQQQSDAMSLQSNDSYQEPRTLTGSMPANFSSNSLSHLPLTEKSLSSLQSKVLKLRRERKVLSIILATILGLVVALCGLMIYYRLHSGKTVMLHTAATQSAAASASMNSLRRVDEYDSLQCDHPSVYGAQGVVTTTHFLATDVGMQVLKEGGNAFDAAAAVQFMLNVVQPQSTGIGGGCFVVGYNSEQDSVFTLDGREEQPSRFNSTSFCRNPECTTLGDACDCSDGVWPFEQRITGGHAVGVPGVMSAMQRLLEDHGSHTLAQVLAPAIKTAREGFPQYEDMYTRLLNNSARMTQFPSTRETYFPLDGMPTPVGELMKNPDLADTLEYLAKHGAQSFYEGKLAQDVVNAAQSQFNPETLLHGALHLDDMSNYRAVYRKPLRTSYRDTEIYGMPMPSSGGITLAQMLNELEEFEISSFKAVRGEFLHRFIDVQDMSFADRNLYMGDSDWINVPKHGLLDKDYARQRVALLSRATQSARAAAGGLLSFGVPPQLNEDLYEAVVPDNDSMNDDHDALHHGRTNGLEDDVAHVDSNSHEEQTLTHSAKPVRRHQKSSTPDGPAAAASASHSPLGRRLLAVEGALSSAASSVKHAASKAVHKIASMLPFHERYAVSDSSDKKGTTHMVIVDRWGNVVSMTTTIEENFGSGVVVPGRGFLLNNELTDFQALPFDPISRKPFANGPQAGRKRRRTALGEDSKTSGGKRPMSSMTPTIVFKARPVKDAKGVTAPAMRPWLALGSPGGSMIIGTVINGLLNVVDFDMCLGDAVDAPRTISQNTNLTLIELPLLNDPQYAVDLALLDRRQFTVGPLITKRPLGYIQAAIIRSDNEYEAIADSKRLPNARAEAF